MPSPSYHGEYQPWADRQVVAGDPDAPLANPMVGLTAEQLRKLADPASDDGASDAGADEHQA
jgi:hypothetical protein